MTSISAASAGNYQSPLQKLQDELQAEANSGAISSSTSGSRRGGARSVGPIFAAISRR